ncbi:hypothetical protein PU849_12130 [Shigella dysenteriae]|nr:hypothetical protein [Shigella dysenteriae]MDS1495659.1 hypothetical protein [Shigella dysenteriae]
MERASMMPSSYLYDQ